MNQPPPADASVASHERREVQYFGHVQGVGFRYTARAVAQRFNVTGFVCNLPDGSVRLVAEGRRDELDRFLGAVRDEMGRYIKTVDVQTSAATGGFDGFSIRM
ncbi:MAG TPA: acylphosphatase [Pirellulales bacterium]|jgi:acylphosphatase|nr:acylphosphatase [Pirellulales bacterium]